MKVKYFRNTSTTYYHQLKGGPASKPVSLGLRLRRDITLHRTLKQLKQEIFKPLKTRLYFSRPSNLKVRTVKSQS